MGLFDFGKKKKEQQMREEFKQKYRAMSLKQLISCMGSLWQVSSDIEEDEIRAAYILAVLKADPSEGGFGIPAGRLMGETNEREIHSYIGSVARYVKERGLAYLRDGNGDITAINRKFVFLGNYMRADKNADLLRASVVTDAFFSLQDKESVFHFSDEEIMDEHHQIYNAWLGEPSAEKGDDGFRRYKMQVVHLICDPEQCEKYGAFKRKNGVVTSEYITVDDLTGAKTSDQLRKLLDTLQTRF